MNLPASEMMQTLLSQSTIVPVFLDHKKFVPQVVHPTTDHDPVRSPGHHRRIFVIDDDSSIADSLIEILNSNGYEALAFYDGWSAIEAARDQCPAFVVADVIMPKLNGIETVIAIHKLCRGTRIVLFSGQSGTLDLLEGARARGYEFELLPKPIHPDRLLRKLANLKKPV